MNEDFGSFKEWVKNHFLNTLPNTVTGYILIFFLALGFNVYNLEFTANVGKTGLYIVALACCYVVGRSSLFWINEVISRIIHSKWIQEEKGSFIVSSAIFAGMVIVIIGINTLWMNIPFTRLEIGLVLGSLLVLIYTKPTIEKYISQDTRSKEETQ